MPLKDDLLTKGYLPENLPPPFHTRDLGTALAGKQGWLSGAASAPARAASYSASKRGLARRVFSVVHPSTGYGLSEFISKKEADLENFYKGTSFSLSKPKHVPAGDRAVSISSHSELESERLTKLSSFRFIAKTDISRFYHSIYTHSIPWALHTKSIAKNDSNPKSANVWGNRLDKILRDGQDRQTIGIPVGPDASRYIAEIIGTAIDSQYLERAQSLNSTVIRHVDDVWIGANTHADAEEALFRYRESIRYFELDINESKTRIYEADFRFTDAWPTEIATSIEFSNLSNSRKSADRLRAALESAFEKAINEADDGILKYALRYLDQSEILIKNWVSVEPFLKRVSVHFGHTIDYVIRILIWRHLVFGDLDVNSWSKIIINLLDRHSRLGNDSEVCWLLYAAIRFNIRVPLGTCQFVIENCGALSIIAILSTIGESSQFNDAYDIAYNFASSENGSGVYWPLLLEWKAKKWTKYNSLSTNNEIIQELIDKNISIFDSGALPAVFQDISEDEYRSVEQAIETGNDTYEDDARNGESSNLDPRDFFDVL